jgi:hypothetical protein
MIYKIICTISAFILIKLPYNSGLVLLEQLELGVYLFCRREAERSHSQAIRSILLTQAISEYNHAQILRILSDGEAKAILPLIENKETINYGKVKLRGKQTKIDGISTNYLSGYYFFQGKPAGSYEISDKLAFMYVLECLQSSFYQIFYQMCSDTIKPQIKYILDEEQEHSEILLKLLQKREPEWNAMIKKWEARKSLALVLTPVDLALRILRDFADLVFWVFQP